MNSLSKSNHKILRKVPEITIYFWIIKVLTTAVGESASDYLVHLINPVIAVIFGAIGLAIALTLQFSVKKYVAWIYWLTVVIVAIFGTMAADVLHIGLGIPYLASTIFFAIVLGFVFIVWYATEKTLSIHSIDTFRREFFYWATVLTTFALGTAGGDLTAATMGLGYLVSGIIFAILIAVVATAYYLIKSFLPPKRQPIAGIIAFWFAYILTRPMGASFADWMGKPHSLSGLGWGDGIVSLYLAILILVFVGYLAITQKDA